MWDRGGEKSGLCWEHYKLTQPAFADDMAKAVIQWLNYKGYTRIALERAAAGGGTVFDIVGATSDGNSVVGVEIKSDHDSYCRLHSQLPDYMEIFDQVYLCLDNKKAPFHPRVGVLRFSDGRISVEKESDCFGLRGVSHILSDGEMAALCKAHGIKNHNEIRRALEILPSVRKKLIYNRFFAKMDWQNRFISEYLPFSDEELQFVLTLGAGVDLNSLKNQVTALAHTAVHVSQLVSATNALVRKARRSRSATPSKP